MDMNGKMKRAPVSVNPLYVHKDELRHSLSGTWGFRLDPDDRGEKEAWYRLPFLFQEHVKVPGCWQGQGYGNDETETHKEFDTEIRAFRATYEGTGWYVKSFRVPPAFYGKRIFLNFGGVAPTAEVYLNGEKLGENHHPLVSFGFDVTELVRADQENFIVVRVSEEDRLLCLSYHYSGKWSGLYRDVELVATGDAYFDRFSVYPNAESGTVTVKTAVGGNTENTWLSACVKLPSGEDIAGGGMWLNGSDAALELSVTSPLLWSPDQPNLYHVEARIVKDGAVSDARIDRFGFVGFQMEGKHFCINHEPYYMRGTGDFCDNPKTGSPNTDRAYWRKCLRALREMGYNYVRCQSFVPVPEYFDAADEVGLIVQSEMGMLAPMCGKSVWHSYNYPYPMPGVRETLRLQWNAIVLRDVNHPSANIYCMGNEQPGTNFKKTVWRCYRETKEMKPTALVIWTDGNYHPDLPGDFVNAQADKDEICNQPLIQHEYMWWSSFPDVRITPKFEGCAMRHYSAEMAVDNALKHGFAHLLPQIAVNSQRLQFIEAKGKMERMRRDHPRLAGICHFNAIDIEMSPQGILDVFYEQKYVTPSQWNQTNGDTVVLSSIEFEDHILPAGDEWGCRCFVSDFSHPAFRSPVLDWSLASQDEILLSGTIEYTHEAYCTAPIGEIRFTVPKIEHALAVTLSVTLREGDRAVSNAWDLWIFPKTASLPDGVYVSKNGEFPENAAAVITPRLTDALVRFAENGGGVILTAAEGLVRPFSPILHLSKGKYYFTRPASYPIYEELQSGTVITDHAAFGTFPYESHADLQFYRMIGESPALDLEGLALADADPIIRSVHSYQIGRPLGYLLERRVGKGVVIVSALKFSADFPESAYLLREIATYARSGDFSRAPLMTEDALHSLISGTNIDP